MKKIDINQGMQRLMESYQPRVSETEVLDFLKKKGFDISAESTQNYAEAVAEYLDYSPEEYSLEDWFKDTEMNYPEDLRLLPKVNKSLKESAGDVNDWISLYLKGHPFDNANEMIEYISEYEDINALEDRFKTDIVGAIEDYFEDNLNEALSEFHEALSDDDAFDFVHDLSEYVKDCARKWKKRGISVADIVRALDELSIRYEDLDEDEF